MAYLFLLHYNCPSFPGGTDAVDTHRYRLCPVQGSYQGLFPVSHAIEEVTDLVPQGVPLIDWNDNGFLLTCKCTFHVQLDFTLVVGSYGRALGAVYRELDLKRRSDPARKSEYYFPYTAAFELEISDVIFIEGVARDFAARKLMNFRDVSPDPPEKIHQVACAS